MSVTVPEGLRHAVLGDHGGPEWLAELDDLAARARLRWDLTLGEPFADGMAAWTAPATTADGTEVVLKLSFPHDEARAEAAALAAWRGSGAVELLDAHPADQALLLRRVRPGSSLRDEDLPIEEHLAVASGVLRRIEAAAVPDDGRFPDLATVADRLAANTEDRIARTLPSAPYDVDLDLCRHAVARMRSLPCSATRRGLNHGDLNPGNILRQDRSPSADVPSDVEWLAIDPKPVHGDLAWDPWPFLTQFGDWLSVPPSPGELADRTLVVADATGLDAARISAWCTARSVASGLWVADRGWWTGFRGADGDLERAAAWAQAERLLDG